MLTEMTAAMGDHRPLDVVIFVGPWSAEALDLCASPRSGRLPLLMVYTETTSDAVVISLDAGADDVMIAPVMPAEFLARVAVAMRYRDALKALASEDVLELPGLQIDLVARTVALDGTSIALPAQEFELLSILARQLGTVVPRATLVERIWPGRAEVGENRLRVCMSQLRKRLGTYPSAPVILPERGVGYAMVLRTTSR